MLCLPFAGALLALCLPACGDDAASSGDGTSTGEGAGATTSSQSGTGSQGTASMSTSNASSSGTSSTVTSGAGGCYATFDGVDDGLFAEVGPEVGLSDGFSLGAFVSPGDLASGETAFVAGRHTDGSSNGYYLALANEGGQLQARAIVFGGAGTCSVSGPVNVQQGGWAHVLASFQSPDARVFVDGQLVASDACNGDGSNIDPASIFTVGRSQTGVFPFAGSLDDVAYYAQAFSAPFDPSTLGCGSNAQLRYSFDAVTPGRTSTIVEDCGPSVDAEVGTGPGSDASDPTFSCP